MQVVIEISEEDLDCIKYLKVKGWASRHELQILNGTPLPENHGRIVDLDTVTVEEDTDKGVLWLDAPTILGASYGK